MASPADYILKTKSWACRRVTLGLEGWRPEGPREGFWLRIWLQHCFLFGIFINFFMYLFVYLFFISDYLLIWVISFFEIIGSWIGIPNEFGFYLFVLIYILFICFSDFFVRLWFQGQLGVLNQPAFRLANIDHMNISSWRYYYYCLIQLHHFLDHLGVGLASPMACIFND